MVAPAEKSASPPLLNSTASLPQLDTAEARYQRSAARDTPECQGILKILAENGYGIEYLESAYRIAAEAHSLDAEHLTASGAKIKRNRQQIDPRDAANAAGLLRLQDLGKKNARYALMRLLGTPMPNEAIEDILKFSPKIPYSDIPGLTSPDP